MRSVLVYSSNNGVLRRKIEGAGTIVNEWDLLRMKVRLGFNAYLPQIIVQDLFIILSRKIGKRYASCMSNKNLFCPRDDFPTVKTKMVSQLALKLILP